MRECIAKEEGRGPSRGRLAVHCMMMSGAPRVSGGRVLRLILAIAALCTLGASLTACSTGRWSRSGSGNSGGSASVDVSGTPGQIDGLMPEELVLHPLSRVGTDLTGAPAIICHLELKDQFGQTVKALGALRVELQQRAGTDAGAGTVGVAGISADADRRIVADASAVDTPTRVGAESVNASSGAGWSRGVAPAEETRRELVWEVDLRDARENARYFDDLVTRTYTLALGGVPAWVVEWSRDPRSQAAGPTLVVTFTCGDGRGGVRTLSAGGRLLK